MVYGTPCYQSLVQFKKQAEIAEVIGLFSTNQGDDAQKRELMDKARKFAMKLELRDSVTLVFAPKTQLDSLMPEHLSE